MDSRSISLKILSLSLEFSLMDGVTVVEMISVRMVELEVEIIVVVMKGNGHDGDGGDDGSGDGDEDGEDDFVGGVFGESSVHTVGGVWQQFVATATFPLHSYTITTFLHLVHCSIFYIPMRSARAIHTYPLLSYTITTFLHRVHCSNPTFLHQH